MGKNEVAPLRVALYVRVSGQEQAIKGLSLEASKKAWRSTPGNEAG